MNRFLAGVSKVLMFKGENLIGVGRTLTDSTLNYSISAEELRAGDGNALWGKFFHTSNLAITITNAMFDLNYIAAALGVDIEQGGLSFKEEQVTAAAGGVLTATSTPIAVSGSVLGWYKTPNEENWSVGTFSGSNLTVSGASAGDIYCIKYFWQNDDGRSIVIPVDAIPDELHLVLINDLFNGDMTANSTDTTRVGRLITDIPRFQSDGGQELSLTATGSAGTSLNGTALAVGASDTCEDELYYGTMTEEIFNTTWQSNVVAIAVEGGDIDLENSATETLKVRVIYGGNVASQVKANSNFTFAVDSGSSATVSNAGVVTADSSATGTTYISVALTGTDVAPTFVKVEVS